MMTYFATEGSARAWGGVKRPPVGRVGRCPAMPGGGDC